MKRDRLIAFICAFLHSVSSSISPRSPRDRKTKSPGTFGSSSPTLMETSPMCSPQLKRRKNVSVSSNVIFHRFDNEEESITDPGSPRIDNFNGMLKSISTSSNEESPQSITNPTIQHLPRPILKIRIPNKSHPSPIHLFKYGDIKDIKSFYDRGIHLSFNSQILKDIFKYILDNKQFPKLKIIYERDQLKLMDFVIKNSENTSDELLMLASNLFCNANEEIYLDLQGSLSEESTIELRVKFYLHAVNFAPQHVYNIVTSLLEDSDSDAELIRTIFKLYNSKNDRIPLLIYAVTTGLEFRLIYEYDQNELYLLDKQNRSAIYHATSQCDLDFLEYVKPKFEETGIPGICPLIGAAIADQKKSLEFFLNSSSIQFSQKEYMDTAFTASAYDNFNFFKILYKAGKVDLYIYKEDSTLLSVALSLKNFSFVKNLVNDLKFHVNFVGEDPINPDGHALAYVLDNLNYVEFFLKRGASRNIKVFLKLNDDTNEDGVLVTLEEYLAIKKDKKLIDLFKKYPQSPI